MWAGGQYCIWNHPVSHAKYLTCQTLPGNSYVKSGK